MEHIKNILIPGVNNRMIALDVFFEEEGWRRPVVIYAHGFNGFKDWGNFDIIAKTFAIIGYAMVKFNFSHNGTTPEQPEDFADLEAFGNNNYSKELEDLRLVVDWVANPDNPYRHVIDNEKISLIGHSMGGGISIIYAAEDSRVTKLITWASIAECNTPWGEWPEERIRKWKETGVEYYVNSRTKQHMPMYYQLYEDYVKNQERLDIKNAIQKLKIPVLICHGNLDSAVSVDKAHQLKTWLPSAELFLVESDHVFGRKHPWTGDEIPRATQAVLQATIEFLDCSE